MLSSDHWALCYSGINIYLSAIVVMFHLYINNGQVIRPPLLVLHAL